MWIRFTLAIILLTLPALAKPNCEDMCGQADRLLKQNKVEAGLDKYREAIRIDPGCARAHAALGEIWAQVVMANKSSKEMAQMAFQELDKAIQLNPKDSKSYCWRGDLKREQGRYSSALIDLNRSLQLHPGSQAYMSRAMCYSHLKKDDLAAADYTSVYALTGEAMCLYNRGNCYRRLGQNDKAEADYQLVISKARDPKVVGWARQDLKQLQTQKLLIGKQEYANTSEKAYAVFDKAEKSLIAGNPREAIKLYDEALQLDPKFAKAAVYKGDAYLELGDEEKAIACYRQGIRLDPKDKQAHRFLGDLLEKKWKRTKQRKFLEEAIASYEEALRIDPDYGYAKVSLKHARQALKTAP